MTPATALRASNSGYLRGFPRFAYPMRISADAVMKKLGASTKLNVDWGFLTHLHAAGRQYAGTWIEECFDRLG